MSDDTVEQLKIGLLCYLHLWAALVKHVQVAHHDIAEGIGLWDDQNGGYFAAYSQGNARMLQAGKTYACALGDEGPTVGQLEKIPPCDPVIIDAQVSYLLEALAHAGPGQTAEISMKQVDVIARMIAMKLPPAKKQKQILN